jgi:NADH:ubiquinone oxidoreductase subunit F (NADH-binding)
LELTFEASQSKSGFDERVREAVRDGVRERLREAVREVVREVVRERVPESNARGSGGLGGFLVGGITHLPLCDYRVVASMSHEGSQVGG